MSYLASSETIKLMECIHNAESIEEMLTILKQIDALKVALESVNAFHEKALMYARLEAEALLRVVELDGLKKLKGTHYQTAKWLSGAEDEERERLIGMCAEGLTIDQVYKREIADPNKQAAKITSLYSLEKSLIDELKEDGVTDIQYYCQEARKTFYGNPTMANDVIDGVRNRLRKAGGVSVGKESYTYIAKGSKNKESIKDAIKLRFESIAEDYESVREIARASDIKFSWSELYDFSGWSFHNDPYLIHLLIAFGRIGLIEDEGSAYDAIVRNDVREEINYIYKQLGISKAKFIELEYKRLRSEKEITE